MVALQSACACQVEKQLVAFSGGVLAFLWRSVLEREASIGDLVWGGIDRLALLVPLKRKSLPARIAVVWSDIC